MNKWIFQSNIPRKGANGSIVEPKTSKDIVKIVSQGGHFLGMGGGFSHSRIDEARKKTTFISSKRIKHIYRVSKLILCSTKTIKRNLDDIIDPIWCRREKYPIHDYFINVGSGVTLKELNLYLKDRDMMLSDQSSVDWETMGGISQTGTHGSGWNLLELSSLIVSIRVILPNGMFASIGKTKKVLKDNDLNDDNMFNSIICGIGAMGFIYDMVIVAQDYIKYNKKVGIAPWLEFRSDLVQMVEDIRHVELFINPKTNNVLVIQKDEKELEFNYKTVKDKMLIPEKTFAIDKYYTATESAIPIYKMVDIIAIINCCLFYLKRKSAFYPIHVRFGKGTSSFLSPTYKHDKDILGFMYIKMSVTLGDTNINTNMQNLINFETYLHSFQSRPHMAKLQGGQVDRPGIKEWSIAYNVFEKNCFSSDFAEELLHV